MLESLEKLQKKLIYKASHRGTKELDILFGNFVKENITNFSKENLIELLDITNCNDHDLWDLFSKKNTQKNIKISTNLEEKIQQYKECKNVS